MKETTKLTTLQKAKWIVIGMFALFILAYAFGNNTPTEPFSPVPTPTPTEAPVNIKDNGFKTIFITGCIDEGGNYDYCNCVWNNLIDENGLSGVLDLAMEFDETSAMTDEFIMAMESCLHLVELE